MEKKKDLMKNIIIIILSITLITLIVIYVINSKSENVEKGIEKTVISEEEYREKLKEELTYELITKPEEERKQREEEEEAQREKENEEQTQKENKGVEIETVTQGPKV